MKQYVNKIILADPVQLVEGFANESINLAITCPNIKQDNGIFNIENYLDDLKIMIDGLYQKITSNGKFCLIIAPNIRPMKKELCSIMGQCGFEVNKTIIWTIDGLQTDSIREIQNSNINENNRSAISSYTIIIFGKRDTPHKNFGGEEEDYDLIVTISRDEMEEYSKTKWVLPGHSINQNEYPIEVAYRLMQLYSYLGDLVVDPNIANGNLSIAALELGRRYIGITKNFEYATKSESDLIRWQELQIDSLDIFDIGNYQLIEYSSGNASCMFCSKMTIYILQHHITRRKIAVCSIHLIMNLSTICSPD